MIDTSDIKEVSAEQFSKGRKNPYAEKLRKNGYSIVINVSPEAIEKSTKSNINLISKMNMLDLDPDEQAAFQKYLKANKDNN